jgi:uncharacterized membrane protein
MATAVLALAGLFISLYLWLHRVGIIGTLQCGTGGCEQVQTSPYAAVAGLPVAAVGAAGYATLLVVALVGLQPGLAARRGPAMALAGLAGLGFAFTLYLKYVEFFVIGTVCWWCVGSAILITSIFVTSLLALRERDDSSP